MIFSALQDSVITFVKFWNPSNIATSLHRPIVTFFRRARNEPGIEGQVSFLTLLGRNSSLPKLPPGGECLIIPLEQYRTYENHICPIPAA